MAEDNELDLSMFGEDSELFTEEPIEGDDPLDVEKLDAEGNPIVNTLGKPEEDDDTPPKPPVVDGEEEGEDDDNDTNKVKLVYNRVASLLKEEGLFDDDMDLKDIKSSNSLVEALKGEIKRSEYSDLSELQSEYLTAIRDGVPENLFLQHKQVDASYRNITKEMITSDESLRKNIVMADLTGKGMAVSRAEKFYKTLEESGDDISEASASLDNLIANEKARYDETVADNDKRIKADATNEKNKAKRLKNSVYELKEIVKDFKITEKLRDKVYETMTKPVAYSEAGQPMNKMVNDRDKDPVGFDTRLAYVYTMTKGFTDFASFKRNASSKAARELERVVLEGGNALNLGGTPNIKDDDQEDIPQITELSNE